MPSRDTDGRMTVVEHLTELRRRIVISLIAVAVTAIACYWFAPDIIRWMLHYYKDATHGKAKRPVVKRGHSQKQHGKAHEAHGRPTTAGHPKKHVVPQPPPAAAAERPPASGTHGNGGGNGPGDAPGQNAPHGSGK